MSGEAKRDKDPSGVYPLKVDAVDVPTGYKRTELGVVPSDWIIKSIYRVAPLQRGFDLPASEIQPGPFPVVYSKGVGDYHKTAKVKGPGVVTGRSGTLGKVYFVENDYWPHNTTLWVTQFNGNDPKFVYCLYDSLHLERFASGSGVPTFNRNDAHRCHVALPFDVVEQRNIAEALTDVDDLLRSLDALIAKKLAIKKAAMQQLLSGKIRLQGFIGEWETKKLGEIASIRNQKILPATVDPETPCIELEHISQGSGYLSDISDASNSSSSKYCFFPEDVLFGRLRPYLRKFWHANIGGICSTEIWPLMVNTNHANSRFLYSLVQTDWFIEAASISYGTHMPRADWTVIRNLEIRLPKPSEQTAISAIFSDIDSEIEALNERLKKTHAIKAGMMQQLLTGRVRLVAKAHEEAAA